MGRAPASTHLVVPLATNVLQLASSAQPALLALEEVHQTRVQGTESATMESMEMGRARALTLVTMERYVIPALATFRKQRTNLKSLLSFAAVTKHNIILRSDYQISSRVNVN